MISIQERGLSYGDKGEGSGREKGRVTGVLPAYPLSPDMLFYLCGNNNMIHDVRNILTSRGVPEEKIFAEIYF